MKDSIAKILYLEDDPDTVEMVTFTLNLSGIDVTTVSSSEEAARLAKREPFDLYLLDGLLPTGDSFDLCRQLRTHSPFIPVVFYSALGFPADIQKGAEAGADAYLVKPYSGDLADTLLETISRAGTSTSAVRQTAH